MKIALFTDTFLPQVNGVVSFLESIMPLLAKENEVLLFAPANRKKIETENLGKNIKVYWVPASPFPFYEGYKVTGVMPRQIWKILRKERVDVVHAHAPVILGLQGMLAAKRLGIPVVATYHTHYPDYFPYIVNGKLPGFLKTIGDRTVRGLIRVLFSMADCSTAPTEELAKELRRYGVKNVVVLPCGIALDKLKSSRHAQKEFRKDQGIEKEKKVILYVGRMGFEKKVDVVLKSLRMLQARDWCFVAIGDGPHRKSYMNDAEGMEANVVFPGYLKDQMLNAAYGSADIFVSASDSETFGLTFVEAMAFGLPVVGVKMLGAREIIRNGENGFTVRPGDSAAMAKKIDLLLKDDALRARMGKEARRTAEKFSINESARQSLEIYINLVKQKRLYSQKPII
jgi:glycosyltransferase involved in cell wall biosynthesis